MDASSQHVEPVERGVVEPDGVDVHHPHPGGASPGHPGPARGRHQPAAVLPVDRGQPVLHRLHAARPQQDGHPHQAGVQSGPVRHPAQPERGEPHPQQGLQPHPHRPRPEGVLLLHHHLPVCAQHHGHDDLAAQPAGDGAGSLRGHHETAALLSVSESVQRQRADQRHLARLVSSRDDGLYWRRRQVSEVVLQELL